MNVFFFSKSKAFNICKISRLANGFGLLLAPLGSVFFFFNQQISDSSCCSNYEKLSHAVRTVECNVGPAVPPMFVGLAIK